MCVVRVSSPLYFFLSTKTNITSQRGQVISKLFLIEISQQGVKKVEEHFWKSCQVMWIDSINERKLKLFLRSNISSYNFLSSKSLINYGSGSSSSSHCIETYINSITDHKAWTWTIFWSSTNESILWLAFLNIGSFNAEQKHLFCDIFAKYLTWQTYLSTGKSK